ncbi:MAG TPA: glycosyltransferase family 39 protein, partial [Acidobacteriota bacterium]|nr:glycosyltransferase family 39 protein [Acidobacteriota bacterium]
MTTNSSGRQLFYRWFCPDSIGFVTFLLVLLTLIFSYPTIFHLATYLPCSHPDAWQFVWNIFNFRELITEGKDPYFTDYMFHPLGTSLLLHNYTEFNDVVGLFLSPFFNDVAITNLMGMLATISSGVGVYMLARHLSGNLVAAVFAAIAFAFSPFRMNRLTFQMHMALTQWIPFALLVFLKCSDTGKLRYALLTGLFFSLAYYCNPYFAVYLLIAFLLMLPCGLLLFPNWRRVTFLKHLVVAGIVAIVLLLPVALRFYKDYQEKTVYSYRYKKEASARIQRYFQRGFMNRYLNDLLGQSHLNKMVGKITRERKYSDITPGWVALAVGLGWIYCVFRYRQKKLMMLSFVAFGFFLLSLGPIISVASTELRMPFYWYTKIPYINHARIPERFAIMVTLILSLTGAYLLALIIPRLNGKKRGVMMAILFTLLLFELAPLPVSIKRFDPPK